MKIKFGSVYLTEDENGPIGFTVNGQRIAQDSARIRAEYIAIFPRGNLGLTISFGARRLFGTFREAQKFALMENQNRPKTDTLTITCGTNGETTEDAILQDAIFMGAVATYIGKSPMVVYTFRAPRVTGTEYDPPADDDMRSGTFDITNGAEGGTVTGLVLPAIPVRILVSVRKPTDGLNLFAAIVDGSESTDGFEFTLNGAADSANYKLDYLLIL